MIKYKKKQRGAVLAIGLLILLVVTLIGITAMSSATMEHRLSSNMIDSSMSFEAAESALNAGEAWILLKVEDVIDGLGALESVPASLCAVKPCQMYDKDSLLTTTGYSSFTDFALSSDWDNWAISYAPADADDLSNVATMPSYVREFLAAPKPGSLKIGTSVNNERYYYYRITAKGTGGSDVATTVLQSVVFTLHQ